METKKKTLTAGQQKLKSYLEEMVHQRQERIKYNEVHEIIAQLLVDEYLGHCKESVKKTTTLSRFMREVYRHDTERKIFYPKRTKEAEKEYIEWSRAKTKQMF